MREVRVPSAWVQTNLASLADYINGFAFNESYWSAEGLPIVRIAQITGSQGIVDRYNGSLPDAYRLDDGDLVFSWSGTLAVVRWNGGPAWLNQHLFKVVPRPGVDCHLLFHLLQASIGEMNKRSHGSTMKHIKRGELSEFRLSLPANSNEQQTLAKILDTLDTTIRQTAVIIEKLKQLKQGLLHDLLTRGIDANGELRPPQSAAPHLYKESRLGWIPIPWREAPLGAIADLQVGFAFKSEWFRDTGDVRLLRGDNVGFGLPDWSAPKFLTESFAAQFNEYALNVGDVIVGMDRLFTKTGAKFSVIGQGDLPCLLVQRVGRFLATGCEMPFLRILTLWPDFHRRLMAQQKGMDIPHLSKAEILEPIVPVPPSDEQQKIAKHIRSIEERVSAELRTANKLKLEKSGLIEDLLTGRVRVTPLLT